MIHITLLTGAKTKANRVNNNKQKFISHQGDCNYCTYHTESNYLRSWLDLCPLVRKIGSRLFLIAYNYACIVHVLVHVHTRIILYSHHISYITIIIILRMHVCSPYVLYNYSLYILRYVLYICICTIHTYFRIF